MSWRVFRSGTVAALALVAVGLAPEPVVAEVRGGCQATLNGVDIGPLSASAPDDAVAVKRDESVTVSVTAPAAVETYSIQLELAGIGWTVAEGTGSGASWSRTIDVDRYARYGAGLYKVSGRSTGGSPCVGAALVRVDGNPLTTVAGAAAAVATVLGLAGMGLSLSRARTRPGRG